jgi:hypothetical protein
MNLLKLDITSYVLATLGLSGIAYGFWTSEKVLVKYNSLSLIEIVSNSTYYERKAPINDATGFVPSNHSAVLT